MTPPPHIFDRALLTARRRRALAGMAAADFLLRYAAAEIGERLNLIKRSFPRALDLAGHTGLIAETLSAHAEIGDVIRAETIPALVANWPDAKLVCDPEALPFGPETLDLVVSTLSLHLVNDLPGALVQIERALRPDGLFLAILLGAGSLSELRQVLLMAETDTTGGASPRVAPFVDVRDMGMLLQRAGFKLPVSDGETLTVTYPDMFSLMHDLRAMGMSNMLTARSRKPLRRATLLRAAELYRQLFSNEAGRIRATFQLVHAAGWKSHESQQKPLKPGSARMRLADALNTIERSAEKP